MKQLLKKIVVYILELEARAVLKVRKPKIVAITGSVGKTSTKDAIAQVLSSYSTVQKSKKSYNSEIGVPLTILNCENAWNSPLGWLWNLVKGFYRIIGPTQYPRWLVLEVGADNPGDIQKITRWLKPDIAVITRLGVTPVHVENFPSRDMLVEEKSYLARAVKDDGLLILNYDDEEVSSFQKYTKNSVMFYGFNQRAHINASNEMTEYGKRNGFEIPLGASIKVNHYGSSVPVRLENVLGRQHIYPVLAAFAVGVSLDINMISISQSFEGHQPPRGRMNLLDGIKNTRIIDDTYNSSPVAVHSALEAFEALRVPHRKIAVLGDMKELGKESEREHRLVGEHVSEVCHMLVTIGKLAKDIADEAKKHGLSESHIHVFDDSQKAGEALEHMIEPGDMILVKGSQSVRCEKVVEEIMNEPERAGELLVRQETEWKRR